MGREPSQRPKNASMLRGMLFFCQAFYGLRLFAGLHGLPGFEGALAGANLMSDVRMLLTSSTIGTLTNARGFANAWSAGTVLPLLQHSSMLLHHPIMLSHWASKHMVPGLAPGLASAFASGCRSLCSGLWL